MKTQLKEFWPPLIIFFLSLALSLIFWQIIDNSPHKLISFLVLLVGVAFSTFIGSIVYLLPHSKAKALGRADLELHRHNLEMSAILAGITDGVVVVDQNKKIIYINPAAAELVGWSAEEITGKVWDEVVEARDEGDKPVDLGNRILARVFSESKTIKNIYKYYRRRENSYFIASAVGSSIIVDDKIYGAVLTFRDITAQQEIDRAKTEFVSLASHQLRTPLSTINWYAEMLLDDKKIKFGSEEKKYIREIYNSNQRMVALLNALLNISRLELGTFAIEYQRVDINNIIEEVVGNLGLRLRAAKLTLEKNIDTSAGQILSDMNILRIVFENLLSNAIKYTPASGKISISVKSSHNGINIVVADTGYGIPKEQQGQIFNKFFRADNVREIDADGTGLGLYIVKSMVEKIGGSVRFESAENKGTVFYINIPRRDMV